MMIGFLRPKDYIDIAHTMLKDYSFFKEWLSNGKGFRGFIMGNKSSV